jgi:hypothetical protein
MAETTADVKRDIELTRERMSSTLAQLERKLNLGKVVKDNPWPALGLAFGAGLLLSGSKADVKAAAAAAVATKGASSKLGTALDDIVAGLMQSVGDALQGHVDRMLSDVKQALGVPTGESASRRTGFSSYTGSHTGSHAVAPQLADTDTHPAPARDSAGSTWAPQSNASIGRAD